MLEHTRAVTLQEINDLSVEQLDSIMSSGGNSIGALLKHIAAIEKAHQLISFQERDFTKEELEIWEDALYLGGIGGERFVDMKYSIMYNFCKKVREESLKYLSEQDDAWLMSERKWPNGVAHNQYYLWFHVLEDEINHRGQIRMMKNKMFENYVK
ncbi:DinB family protein [Bacillus paranthracis]